MQSTQSRPTAPQDGSSPYSPPVVAPLSIRKISRDVVSPPGDSIRPPMLGIPRAMSPPTGDSVMSIRPPMLGVKRSMAPPTPGGGSLRPPMLGIPRSMSPAAKTPSLSLAIPGSSGSAKPTPRLGLAIPAGTNNFAGGYFDGPQPAEMTPLAEDGDVTLKPMQTMKQAPVGMKDLQNALEEIEAMLPTSSSAPPKLATATARADDRDDTDDEVASALRSLQAHRYSDEVLIEMDRLGEGAGGAVHIVKDKRNDMIMARKTITTREAPMKQLLRELQFVSSTSHPNIIQFYGAYISPSSSEIKIIIELCEGKSLEAVGRRLRDRGASLTEVVSGRLADGVLQGLDYLHSKKMIHRDIKPANILLTRKGVVKLCDFGVSGELVDSMAGTFTGTSFYMAPERISGSQYTIRSDVWSSGITLLELVQNRYPFPADLSAIELMMAITSSEPPQLEGDWSDDMKDFIKTMLTVSATDRPTPGEMLRHRWLASIMQGPKVNMAAWMRQIWGWPSPPKKGREGN